jgi:cytoskeletal protein CcmA (bactofilin family)
VSGQVSSTRDLYVDGEVDGCIEVLGHHLTLGPSAKARAKIIARTLTLEGTSVGDVEVTGRLALSKTARLTGNIRAGDVSIEDGAYFNGSIDIVEPKIQKAATSKRKAATRGANTT